MSADPNAKHFYFIGFKSFSERPACVRKDNLNLNLYLHFIIAASPPQNGARHLRWGRQGAMIAMATRLTLFVATSPVSLTLVAVTMVSKGKRLFSLAIKLNCFPFSAIKIMEKKNP